MHDTEEKDVDGSELLEDPARHERCFYLTHTEDWGLSGKHHFFFITSFYTLRNIFFDGLGRLLIVDSAKHVIEETFEVQASRCSHT